MFKSEIAFNELPLLPPDKFLVETIPVLKQESKAAVALAELKGLAKTLPNQHILINGIVLKEAKASSEIENVITTHDKLYKALTLNDEKVDNATKEVLRYREALMTGFSFVNERGFLSTNGIIEIQEKLEGNNAGIRKLPGTALKNDLTNEIIYTPPNDPGAINTLMANLETFININNEDDYSPLLKMAIQHYQFESIHPFYDGNGRTGRIINVLHLILAGLLEIPILYLSGYIIANKGKYYKLLREVGLHNKWEDWLIYILKGVEITSKDTIKQIDSINNLFYETVRKTKEQAIRVYSKDLIELLFEQPYCRIDRVMSRLECSRKTASTYLNTLVEIGVLENLNIGRDVIFINKPLYNLFKS